MNNRRNYLHNAALLTGSGLVLRLLGMGLRVMVAAALGSEGMGLYQLILALYMVFVSFATAGIHVASARLAAQSLARGSGMAQTLRGLCGTALGFGTALRKDLFRHIGTLSYSELDGIGTPTLVTRMTSDINQVQNGVNLTLRLLLRSPFIVIGALIMAFSISPKLTMLFIGVTIMVSLIIWAIMRVTVPIYHEAQNGLDRVTLLTRENYVGARVVRAFARQADELAAFVETNDHLKKLQFAAGRISALMNPLTYLVVNLAVVALLLRGGVEVDAGKLTQGEVNTVARVLQNMKDSVSRSVRDKRTDTGGDIRTTAQRRKIYALCEALGWNDDPRRIQGFVKRVAHVDRIEWLNMAQCEKVIEGLKAILARQRRKEAEL